MSYDTNARAWSEGDVFDDARDIVLIVTGLVWTVVFLVLFIITVVVAYFIRRYMRVAHDFLTHQVPGAIGEVHAYAELARSGTASLPGARSRIAPEERLAHVALQLPHLRRRKRWWQRVLPG
jgi:hypothetical protein